MAGLKLLGTPVHVWSEGDRGRSATAQAPKDRAPAPDPGARKTKTGWFRALARDERPWDGMAPPDVAFTYAPGRGGKHAETILDGFKGVLQGEADQRAFQWRDRPPNGYARLIAPTRAGAKIRLAHRWAHARRRLIELTRAGPSPVAEERLTLIR
jgi:transposase